MNSFQQFQPQLFLISENVSCHKLLSTLSVSFHGTLCPQKPYKLLGMGKGRDWVEMKAHSSATTCKDWRIVIHHKNNNVKEVRTPSVPSSLCTSLENVSFVFIRESCRQVPETTCWGRPIDLWRPPCRHVPETTCWGRLIDLWRPPCRHVPETTCWGRLTGRWRPSSTAVCRNWNGQLDSPGKTDRPCDQRTTKS